MRPQVPPIEAILAEVYNPVLFRRWVESKPEKHRFQRGPLGMPTALYEYMLETCGWLAAEAFNDSVYASRLDTPRAWDDFLCEDLLWSEINITRDEMLAGLASACAQSCNLTTSTPSMETEGATTDDALREEEVYAHG